MEETISLQDIFQTIKKRILLILAITILVTLASWGITKFFMAPKYDASIQILVNQSNSQQSNSINYNDIQTNLQLINTYSVIIKSPIILNDVIQQLNLNNGIPGTISVNSSQDSQVFSVTVETTNAADSVNIANSVANVFQNKIKSIMNVNNVSILSKANLATSSFPVKPNLKLNTSIGFVLGILLSIGLTFLLDYLDNSVKTEEDIVRYLELPILGAIMEISEEKSQKKRAANKVQIVRSEHIEG